MQLVDRQEDRRRWHHLHALQNTFKILINSFYGYLGFAQGNFADFDAAARVTQIGRELLQKMIDWLNSRGAQVIEVDTDGIYFVPPSAVAASLRDASGEDARSQDDRDGNVARRATATGKAIEELRRGLSEILPPGIEVEFDE